MTYADFKHTDLHTCLIVAGELLVAISKFAFKTIKVLFKGCRWLAVKTYLYVMA